VALNAPSNNYMSFSAAYESISGDSVLVYADNTNIPKYRIWNGLTLTAQSSMPAAQNKAEMAQNCI